MTIALRGLPIISYFQSIDIITNTLRGKEIVILKQPIANTVWAVGHQMFTLIKCEVLRLRSRSRESYEPQCIYKL